jgi:tRNA (mo5U34)-methyltransferase
MAYELLIKRMQAAGLELWADIVGAQIDSALDTSKHGNLESWQQVIAQLPVIEAQEIRLDKFVVSVTGGALNKAAKNNLTAALKQLMPWRKGPYNIHGVAIDTEWRSDWKWDRLANDIQPLQGKVVLDVGCGNGYHGWRMLGAGAELVIGVDPSPLFVMQHQCIKHFTGDTPFYVLPLGIESVPEKLHAFDTVFSMGVLYHRRSPIDHIMQLRHCLQAGGELILETLVIDGDKNQLLMPEGRYAMMRNVWFIPSCDAIILWLKRCGFKNIKLIDVSVTTTDEQRSTEWMPFDSLATFLDPLNSDLTIEAYPAPTRAVFSAIAP